MTDLTKKNCPIKVKPTEEALKAFEIVKAKLLEPPILRTPDFSREFLIHADASEFGAGGYLSQIFEDGQEHSIAYYSTKFTEAQTKWSVVIREAYAILQTLHKFESFVYGRPVRVMSDHKPLRYLQTSSGENPKLLRWGMALSKFMIVDFNYIPGAQNIVSDSLSRLEAEEVMSTGGNAFLA